MDGEACRLPVRVQSLCRANPVCTGSSTKPPYSSPHTGRHGCHIPPPALLQCNFYFKPCPNLCMAIFIESVRKFGQWSSKNEYKTSKGLITFHNSY